MAFLNAQKLLYVGNHALQVTGPEYKDWFVSGSLYLALPGDSTSWYVQPAMKANFFSGDFDSSYVLESSIFSESYWYGTTKWFNSASGLKIRSDTDFFNVYVKTTLSITANNTFTRSSNQTANSASASVGISSYFVTPYTQQSAYGYTIEPESATNYLKMSGSASGYSSLPTASAKPGNPYITYRVIRASAEFTTEESALSARFKNDNSITGYSAKYTPSTAPKPYIYITSVNSTGGNPNCVTTRNWSASGRVLV